MPGIGVKSAQRILYARKKGSLALEDLKQMGVVLKRARYFICARGYTPAPHMGREGAVRALIDPNAFAFGMEQMSLFAPAFGLDPALLALTPQKEAEEEAIACIAKAI